jgi:MYXO-CTERM domain-containing protein
VTRRSLAVGVLALLSAPGLVAEAQKVYLNPSDQTGNAVSGGGNEAQYQLICANQAKALLVAAGFSVVVDQDFTNAPSNANSWGADIFVSMHTNAGGGHGTETLYVSDGGKKLATQVQNALVASLKLTDRGLKLRTDLHVLNATDMYACLDEALFHDCATTSGWAGHPPPESDQLRSAAGQTLIAQGVANGVCAYYSKSCTTTPAKGTLKGTVYRTPNLAAVIADATVSITGGSSVTTSSTGTFSFDLAAGSYTVTATKAGYVAGSVSATVTASQETWASIGLQPVPGDGSVGLDVGLDVPPLVADGVAPRPGEGCSCRLSDSSSSPPAMLALAVLALVLARTRRRRR